MGKARCLIGLAVVVVVALLPSAAEAAAPQIYVGSNPDYTFAFKAEGGRISLLAFTAPIFCTFGPPPLERFPGVAYMVQAPTLMHKGGRGLEAPLHPHGGPLSYVRASVQGKQLAGTFALDEDEGSADCQTVDFKPASPAVRFMAARYEPAAGRATRSPEKGEVPVYYGNEGGVEVLLETTNGQIHFRGAAPTGCPFAGKQPTGGRAPLFGDVEGAALAPDRSFDRTFHRHGKIDGKTWTEATTVSGVIEGESISGTYRRTTTIRPAQGPPRTCKGDPLTFGAVRYLPAAGSR